MRKPPDLYKTLDPYFLIVKVLYNFLRHLHLSGWNLSWPELVSPIQLVIASEPSPN